MTGTTARGGAAARLALALSLGIALVACGGGESETPNEPSFDGDAGTFTDARDGQVYRWVRIGEQIWTEQNMTYESPEGSLAYAHGARATNEQNSSNILASNPTFERRCCTLLSGRPRRRGEGGEPRTTKGSGR